MREELRHRSNKNVPESATTNKLRPFAFPKKQTEKPDCRHSRPAEDCAPPKRASTSPVMPSHCRVGAARQPEFCTTGVTSDTQRWRCNLLILSCQSNLEASITFSRASFGCQRESSMPIFFFNLKTAEGTIRDDGMELRDELSAREHARTVACELMRNREPLTRSWRLDVRDGAGRQCFDLLFATVDEAPRRARGHAVV